MTFYEVIDLMKGDIGSKYTHDGYELETVNKDVVLLTRPDGTHDIAYQHGYSNLTWLDVEKLRGVCWKRDAEG